MCDPLHATPNKLHLAPCILHPTTCPLLPASQIKGRLKTDTLSVTFPVGLREINLEGYDPQGLLGAACQPLASRS